MRDVWNCAKNHCRFRIVSHAAVTCTVISPLVLNDWVTFFVRILQNKGPAHHKRYTGMLSRKVCYKSPLTPCKRLCTELHSKSCGGSFQTPAFEKESIPLIWVLLFSNSVFVCFLFVCFSAVGVYYKGKRMAKGDGQRYGMVLSVLVTLSLVYSIPMLLLLFT